jgi:F0F1-type ATP synthase epsilon subunit
MNTLFQIAFTTPEGPAFEGECESIVVPGAGGTFGILAGHAPMLGVVKAGVLSMQRGGKTSWYMVGDGFLEIKAGATAFWVDALVVADNEGDAEEKLDDYQKKSRLPAMVNPGSLEYDRKT